MILRSQKMSMDSFSSSNLLSIISSSFKMLEKIGLPTKPSLRGNTWVVDASHCQGCSSQFTFIHRKENLCKANTWQRTQLTTDVVSLLSEIRIGTGRNNCWTGTKTANVPAVLAAAATSGANFKLTKF